MKRIARRGQYFSIVILFFIICGIVFINDYRKNATKWVSHPSNKNIYNEGELATSGIVYSRDGVKLVESNSSGLSYIEDSTLREATLHVVGDRADNIATGVLSSKRTRLIGYDLLNGVYNAKNKQQIINLTIDSSLSKVAYQALGNSKGAIGIYNYKTGEILCMVSSPSYDPNTEINPDDYDGVYVNRVMNGLFVPGSIMKLVTTYAAIETIDTIYEQQFECHHGTYVDGVWIECTGNHGTISFEEAISVSCNAAFAQISLQLGSDVILEYAKKAGITSSYNIDGISSSKSSLDLTNASDLQVAWSGIGQHNTLANPISFLLYVGAIANDGLIKTPYYVMDSSFNPFSMLSSDQRLLSASTASKLKALMRNNTVSNYGDDRFPNMELCAKTGTAEVESGEPHSWFVGFSNNPNTPFAFVIVVENGAYSNPAISIAKTVLAQAVTLFE